MESKGKLLSVARDWITGKFRVTFEVEDDISGQIDQKLKKMAQQYYEAHCGSREDFRNEFGKSYL